MTDYTLIRRAIEMAAFYNSLPGIRAHAEGGDVVLRFFVPDAGEIAPIQPADWTQSDDWTPPTIVTIMTDPAIAALRVDMNNELEEIQAQLDAHKACVADLYAQGTAAHHPVPGFDARPRRVGDDFPSDVEPGCDLCGLPKEGAITT